MQVVVPSVSRATVLQGTALTVFVETPSLATTSRPVGVPGFNGPPGCGTTSAPAGPDGATPTVVSEGTVPGNCWANPASGSMVTATAAIRAILRIGASYGYSHRMEMAPQKFNLMRRFCFRATPIAVRFCNARLFRERLSGQPIRHGLPPITDQLLPLLELDRKIGERPFLRRNNALDLADGRGAFPRIFLAAEAMNFEATIIGHHVLKAELRQPAELQQFGEREIDADLAFRGRLPSDAGGMPLQPACLADRIANRPKSRMIRIGRALLPAFAGDGVECLEGFCHALGNGLPLEFVVRADAPGDLARGFHHALETALLKI